MFENIVWSAQSCSLKTFVDSYALPQLVKVEDGFYSDHYAKTLSAEQIFTLHFTKRTDKLIVQAADRKQYLVPINSPCKVEILPKICHDIYKSVEDIVHAWTSEDFKFIRPVHNAPPQMRIKAGDILKLKKTVEVNRVKFLECEFCDKTQDVVKLNLDFKADFEPLAAAGEYQLKEVLNTFQLPLRVKFTSGDATIQNANNDIADLTSLGSVLLKELRQETTIIATSREGGTVTVLMFPTDLDVTVFPAEGAVIGDKEYARFCRDIHDGTELSKVDLSDHEDRLKSFEEPTVDFVYDYVEVKPLLPPRNRGEAKQREDSDSSDDYEVVDLEPSTLPPRPPKPAPKPKPKPISPTRVPQYQNRELNDDVVAQKESSSHFEEASGSKDVDHEPRSTPPTIPPNPAPKPKPKPISPTRVPQYESRELNDDVVAQKESSSNFEEASGSQDVDHEPRSTPPTIPPNPAPKPKLKPISPACAPHMLNDDVVAPKENSSNFEEGSFDVYDDVDLEQPPPPPPRLASKPKPGPIRPTSVPQYENMSINDVVALPGRPSNFKEAFGFQDESNVNADDGDDEDPYLRSDHDSDEDYIYPDVDYQEPSLPSDDELKASPKTPDPSKKSNTLDKIKRMFKKKIRSPPSSPTFHPSGHSQGASGGTVSPQGHGLSPSSPTGQSNFQTWPSVKGAALHQAFPDELSCLSVHEVADCLTKLHMAEHVENFEQNQIDGAFLITLDEATLPSLEVTDIFQQHKLLMFIKGWRPKNHTWPSARAEVLSQAFPDDLRRLSVQEVGECLTKLNMAEHVEKFELDRIDGELLVTLDQAMLPYLGVTDIFQQRKLLKFKNGWRPKT